MIIWMQRIFAQHDQLRDLWDRHEADIAAVQALVIPTKRRVDELRDALDELCEEHKAARSAAKRNMQMIAGVERPARMRTRSIYV